MDSPTNEELMARVEVESEKLQRLEEAAQALLMLRGPMVFDEVDKAPMYFVERIIKRRKKPSGRYYYNVKWLGFDDPQDNTWEPANNLPHELVQEFNQQQHPRRRRTKAKK